MFPMISIGFASYTLLNTENRLANFEAVEVQLFVPTPARLLLEIKVRYFRRRLLVALPS